MIAAPRTSPWPGGRAAHDASFFLWGAETAPSAPGGLAREDALVLAPAEKEAHEEARDDELDRRRDAATAVPAVEAVAGEELASARPREAKDVLEVRRRSGERAAHGWIERSPERGEEQHPGDARADLEAAIGNVLVWHPIACKMEQ